LVEGRENVNGDFDLRPFVLKESTDTADSNNAETQVVDILIVCQYTFSRSIDCVTSDDDDVTMDVGSMDNVPCVIMRIGLLSERQNSRRRTIKKL
jgi:hypothetical protein